MAAAVPPSTRPFPHVEGVSHYFAQAGEIRMHYAEAGTGEPLVLLHGWPQHWYMWRRQIPELAKHYRVIAPDTRGFGWSEAPPGSYDKRELATDLINFLDALGLDRVRLAGHDWGGWAGFLACIAHPQRFERFVALNIPPPWPKTDLHTVAASRRFWYMGVAASPLGRYLLRNRPRDVMDRTLRGRSPNPSAWSDEEVAVFADQFREPARVEASVMLYRTFLTREFPALVSRRYVDGRLTTPTLLLSGADDFAISPSMYRGYEPHVDDFGLELLPDTGHFSTEERPEAINRQMLEFLGAGDRVAAA